MRTIILSFEPKWFELLRTGKIKFEYRKTLPKEEVKVYFYISKPVKGVCGVAHFGKRIPLLSWLDKFSDRSPEVIKRIDEYLQDCKYVAPIIDFQDTNIIPLTELRNIEGFVVPRMYYYIDETPMLDYLENNLNEVSQKIVNDFNNVSDDDICKY